MEKKSEIQTLKLLIIFVCIKGGTSKSLAYDRILKVKIQYFLIE